jgi:hypothetical protein
MGHKISVNIYIEEDVWKAIKSELKEAGYPKGAPSWLAQRAYQQALRELREDGISHQLELFAGSGGHK